MTTCTVLFDLPAPARAGGSGSAPSSVGLVVLLLVGLALLAAGRQRQLDPARWAILFDPARRAPAAARRRWSTPSRSPRVAMVAATVLGALLAVGRLSDHGWVRVPVDRGRRVLPRGAAAGPDPVLLLLCPGSLTAFGALALGLTLYNMAVLAEIFRAGILSVDRGQSEAAFALGMRKWQVMTAVLMPQAVRRMLPVLIAQLVVLLKDTSLGLHRRLLASCCGRRAAWSSTSTSGSATDLHVPALRGGRADLHHRQRAAVAAGRYVEEGRRRNKKAAATAKVELPADMQMGGGGGAAPPGHEPVRRGAASAMCRRPGGTLAATMETRDAVVARALPPVPRPGSAQETPAGSAPSSSSPAMRAAATGVGRRPGRRCRPSSPKSSPRPATDGPAAAWCCATPVARSPTRRSSGPPAHPPSRPANGSTGRSAVGWPPVNAREDVLVASRPGRARTAWPSTSCAWDRGRLSPRESSAERVSLPVAMRDDGRAARPSRATCRLRAPQ